jgi:hypothetical protein
MERSVHSRSTDPFDPGLLRSTSRPPYIADTEICAAWGLGGSLFPVHPRAVDLVLSTLFCALGVTSEFRLRRGRWAPVVWDWLALAVVVGAMVPALWRGPGLLPVWLLALGVWLARMGLLWWFQRRGRRISE